MHPSAAAITGGPIADTTPVAGLTITPIYWIPSTTTQFPAGYQSLINGYISNIAAASLSTSNVYSVTSQYYSIAGSTKTFLRYKYTAGTPIVDTHPFPANGCTPVSGFTNCITDTQTQGGTDAPEDGRRPGHGPVPLLSFVHRPDG